MPAFAIIKSRGYVAGPSKPRVVTQTELENARMEWELSPRLQAAYPDVNEFLAICRQVGRAQAMQLALGAA